MEMRMEWASRIVETGLLISVRSVEEAEEAYRGGADIIDVKEPSQGSLGRASEEIVQQIVEKFRYKAPLSMALGEWNESATITQNELTGLNYVKWGLSGISTLPTQIEEINRNWNSPRPVLVAYADAKRAQTSEPEYWTEIAQKHQFTTLLIDTYLKDGSTLLDWIFLPRLKKLVDRVRAEGIRIALAGSLREQQIQQLLPLQPDWIAVRGAACATGDRKGTICRQRVSNLARLIRAGQSDSSTSSACKSP
jgi:uncharacterized protein (UPF0264 family)